MKRQLVLRHRAVALLFVGDVAAFEPLLVVLAFFVDILDALEERLDFRALVELVDPGLGLHRLFDRLFFEVDRARHLTFERAERFFAFAHRGAQRFERFAGDERRAIEPARAAEGEQILEERRRLDPALVDVVRVASSRIAGSCGARVARRSSSNERAFLISFLQLLALLRERRLDRGFGRGDLLAHVAPLRVLVGARSRSSCSKSGMSYGDASAASGSASASAVSSGGRRSRRLDLEVLLLARLDGHDRSVGDDLAVGDRGQRRGRDEIGLVGRHRRSYRKDETRPLPKRLGAAGSVHPSLPAYHGGHSVPSDEAGSLSCEARGHPLGRAECGGLNSCARRTSSPNMRASHALALGLLLVLAGPPGPGGISPNARRPRHRRSPSTTPRRTVRRWSHGASRSARRATGARSLFMPPSKRSPDRRPGSKRFASRTVPASSRSSLNGSTVDVDLSEDVGRSVEGSFNEAAEFKALVYTLTGSARHRRPST